MAKDYGQTSSVKEALIVLFLLLAAAGGLMLYATHHG